MTPLCILPCKDAIEKLGFSRTMTDQQNFIVTFGLVTVTFLSSVFVSSIADVILVVGATCNTLVGFSLPILFYLEMDRDRSNPVSAKRIAAHIIHVSFVLLSATSLFFFI